MYSSQTKLARAIALCVALLFLTYAQTHAQSPGAVADLAARINRERLARGLVPYALNTQLTVDAQAHAQDIGSMGQYGHTGTDGSTVTDRAARAGYGKYSWGYRIGENWARYHDTATAMAMWMESALHRNNILHALYREFGIGVASAQNGGFVYVVVFGAQPNVLPIFVNDGATETRTLDVTITLSNEEVAQNGDGANNIGRAVEVQISNAADFASAKWQPFAQHVSWALMPGGGTKTIYVKYRDAKGRTTTVSDSIVYGALADLNRALVVPTVTVTATSTPRMTQTATRTLLRPTSTATPTLSPTGTPTATLTETPTATPIATTDRRLPTAEIATASPTRMLSLSTAAAGDAYPVEPPNLFALGAFGVAVMLSILIVVKSLAERA